MFVHFESGAMKGGVCLFGLISNINSVSQKSLPAPLRQDIMAKVSLWI